jgi:hypothetical protein
MRALYVLASRPISVVDSTQLTYFSVQCLLMVPWAYAITSIVPCLKSSRKCAFGIGFLVCYSQHK